MSSHSEDEEIFDDEPPTCEPYTVLGIEKSATPDQIKSAYRKAALKHHPDKAPPSQKEAATEKFQELAFAYAVLSDPIRRSRYDATGSTAESLAADGDFSWAEFYRSQFADIITADSIEKFSKQFKGSDEEKNSVLAAYVKYKGKWKGIFETVMLSDCLEDEDRFRGYIDEAIAKGVVEGFKSYTGETAKQKERRLGQVRKNRDREAEEAMELAEELGVKGKLFGGGGVNKKPKGEDALASLIKSRQAGRGKFLDALEEKYGGGQSKKGKKEKGKKRVVDDDEDDGEPSEEAFQAAAAQMKAGKNGDVNGRKAKKAKR